MLIYIKICKLCLFIYLSVSLSYCVFVYATIFLFVCLFVILCVRPRKKNFFWRLTYLILILKPVSKHKEYICILFVQMN